MQAWVCSSVARCLFSLYRPWVLIPEQAPNETKQNNLVPGAENSGPSDYELPTALGRHAPVLEKMKLKTQANKVQYLNLTGWTSYKVQACSQLMICD